MDTSWIERGCSGCKHSLITYRVDGRVREASCGYARAQETDPAKRARMNEPVADLSSCPDKDRMSKESSRR